MKKKIGLVLAGGGGNGAYQLGVWKYLCEISLAPCVSVMSGASVGALNAALFATTGYDETETIWTQGIKDKILLLQKSTANAVGLIVSSLTAEEKNADVAIRSAAELMGNGIWSRDGLGEIISRVNLSRLCEKSPKVYASCFAVFPPLGTRYFCLNGMEESKQKKILLASSAIPLVFKPETVDGILYYDGGLKENVPAEPLLREKCTHIIAVHLSKSDKIKSPIPEGVKRIEIRPSVKLGKSGVLDFSPERVRKLLELGYWDCRKGFQTLSLQS